MTRSHLEVAGLYKSSLITPFNHLLFLRLLIMKLKYSGKIIIALGVIALISFLFLPVAHAHGGGCRKDSPSGKGCHMNLKTGVFHCH